MTEELRPIPGLDGYYASSAGTIISTKQGRRKVLKESLVKGYKSVTVMTGEKTIGCRRYVHTLVCTAFHGERPSPEHQVRHLDSDVSNCAPGNLSWGTKEDQMDDRRSMTPERRAGRPRLNLPKPEKRPPPVVPDCRKIPFEEDARYLLGEDGHVYSPFGRILDASVVPGGGYRRVSIGGRAKYVAVMVCTAFHGPKPSPEHQVRHLDNDPQNDRASNLRWGTPGEQMDDRRAAGTLRGERHGRVYLPDERVIEIVARAAAGERHSDIAAGMGIPPKTAANIATRKTRAEVEMPDPLPEFEPFPRARNVGRGHGFARDASEAVTAETVAEVRRLRDAEHMSFADIGARLGFSRSTANRIHSGEIAPR